MKSLVFSAWLTISAESFARLDVMSGIAALAVALGLLAFFVWSAGREAIVRRVDFYGYRLGATNVIEVTRGGQTWAFRFHSPSQLIAAVSRPSLGFSFDEIRECERLAVELSGVK